MSASSGRERLGALGQGGRLRALFSDSAVYGLSSALNKSIALVTFPLLARYFSVAEYGAIDFVMVLVNMAALLIVFGQDSAVARFLHDTPDDEGRSALVTQSLTLLLGLIVLLAPLAWWLSPKLLQEFSAVGSAGTLSTFILLLLPCVVLVNFCQSLLRWTFQRGKYLVLSLGSSLGFAVCLLLLLRSPARAPADVFAAYLAVQAVCAGLALIFVRRWLRIPRGFDRLPSLLRFAAPIGVNCVLLALVPMYERLLVNDAASAQDLGLYAAGAKIAGLISLATVAFQNGWGPFSLALHGERDAARTYNVVLKFYAGFACLAVLGLSALGPTLLVLLASPKYAGAWAIIFPLSLGLALQGFGWVVETGTTISKRTHFALFANLALFICVIVACALLVRPLGIVGVAIGVSLGYAVFAAFTCGLARFAWSMSWQFAPALGAVLITVLVGALQFFVGRRLGMSGAAITCALGILVLLAYLWFGAFDAEERRALRSRFSHD
jgi:O-antigen/teichoic acid export membrane protein